MVSKILLIDLKEKCYVSNNWFELLSPSLVSPIANVMGFIIAKNN